MSKCATVNFVVKSLDLIYEYDLKPLERKLNEVVNKGLGDWIKEDIKKAQQMVADIKVFSPNYRSVSATKEKEIIDTFHQAESLVYILGVKAEFAKNGVIMDKIPPGQVLSTIFDSLLADVATYKLASLEADKQRNILTKTKLSIDNKQEISYASLERILIEASRVLTPLKKQALQRKDMRERIKASLKEQGFIVMNESEGTDELRLEMSNSSSNNAKFVISKDGSVNYDFDNFVGDACQGSIDELLGGLSKVYTIKEVATLREDKPLLRSVSYINTSASQSIGRPF